MGIYYFLLNDSKKECVEVDGHIKLGPITMNAGVQYAIVNYIMCNIGDSMRMVADNNYEYTKYSEVDLLSYHFDDPIVTTTIVDKLNISCGREQYKVIDGVVVEQD